MKIELLILKMTDKSQPECTNYNSDLSIGVKLANLNRKMKPVWCLLNNDPGKWPSYPTDCMKMFPANYNTLKFTVFQWLKWQKFWDFILCQNLLNGGRNAPFVC